MSDPEQTELLIAMLNNPRSKPGQKAQAARLLGENGDPAAIPALITAIEETADPFKLQVVTAAMAALPAFGSVAVEHYKRVLAGEDAMRRPYMPRLLVETGDPNVTAVLLECLHDWQQDVVLNAITALGSMKVPEAYEALVHLLEDAEVASGVRGIAASALGTTGDARAFEPLAALLSSSDRDLLAGAIDGIAEMGDPRAIEPLGAVLAQGGLDEALERGVRLAITSLRARRNERERGLR